MGDGCDEAVVECVVELGTRYYVAVGTLVENCATGDGYAAGEKRVVNIVMVVAVGVGIVTVVG